ncbi:hypothetical protein BH09MYX1_BH09MYX1_58180 [soil metagenome]
MLPDRNVEAVETGDGLLVGQPEPTPHELRICKNLRVRLASDQGVEQGDCIWPFEVCGRDHCCLPHHGLAVTEE